MTFIRYDLAGDGSFTGWVYVDTYLHVARRIIKRLNGLLWRGRLLCALISNRDLADSSQPWRVPHWKTKQTISEADLLDLRELANEAPDADLPVSGS